MAVRGSVSESVSAGAAFVMAVRVDGSTCVGRCAGLRVRVNGRDSFEAVKIDGNGTKAGTEEGESI